MYNSWLWNCNFAGNFAKSSMYFVSHRLRQKFTTILGIFNHSWLWPTYKVVVAGELVTLGRRWFGRVFGLFGCLGVERCLGDQAGGASELILRWVWAAVRLTWRFHRHLLPENKRNICRTSVICCLFIISSCEILFLSCNISDERDWSAVVGEVKTRLWFFDAFTLSTD